MGHPQLRILYTTPESLFSQRYEDYFGKAYRQKQIVRLVVDEVNYFAYFNRCR
jgi:bloom syndrome protein